jgi:L-asparaginase II
MMVYSYLGERCTIKFWKKVVFCVIDHMVLNSYITYKENHPIKQMTRLQYTSSIIEALESEWFGKTECDVSTHTGQSISGPKV